VRPNRPDNYGFRPNPAREPLTEGSPFTHARREHPKIAAFLYTLQFSPDIPHLWEWFFEIGDVESSNVMNTACIFHEGDIKNIEGRLLTIIDSLGFEAEQKSAVKSLVRQAVWDEVDKPYRIWISSELEEEVWKHQEERKKGQRSEAPEKKKSK
jgi:hypothetical protein